MLPEVYPPPGSSLGAEWSHGGSRGCCGCVMSGMAQEHIGALLPHPGRVPSMSPFSEPCLESFFGDPTTLSPFPSTFSLPSLLHLPLNPRCGHAAGRQPRGPPCPWYLLQCPKEQRPDLALTHGVGQLVEGEGPLGRSSRPFSAVPDAHTGSGGRGAPRLPGVPMQQHVPKGEIWHRVPGGREKSCFGSLGHPVPSVSSPERPMRISPTGEHRLQK